jgi:phenylacetate-CoA ligase
LPPSLRQELSGRGVEVLQCYAVAETGVIAYETPAREGMVVGETLIVEIVRPGTGDPVPEGDVGEVVVTSFNADYPMIRLATGDMSAIMSGRSPCGRTNMRIKAGWAAPTRPPRSKGCSCARNRSPKSPGAIPSSAASACRSAATANRTS